MTPFETVLGPRFHHLMPQLRQLHGARAPLWRGQVSVQTASGLLGRAIARFGGFPSAMQKAPMTIHIAPQQGGSEIWTRDFDGHVLKSTIWVDEATGDLRETIGPASFILRPQVRADTLHVHLGKTLLFGRWTLPKGLAVKSDSSIWQDEAGRYRFDIKASLSGLGQFMRYEGWLRPEMQSGFVAD